jgi:hypothetical protein
MSLALLFGIAAVFLFSLAHIGIQTSDDAAMLATTGALWDKHTFAIPDMEWLNERVTIGKYGKDGLLYAKFGAGQTLVAAVLYGIGEALFPKAEPYMWAGYPIVNSSAGAQLALFDNVVLAGLIVGLVVYEAGELCGAHAATITGIMLTLASPFLFAARVFGAEIGAALGLLLAAMLARRALKPDSSIPLWVSVAGLGIAVLFRPSALVFGFAWLVWVSRRPLRDWLSVGIALALVTATIPGYNWLRYGDIFESGYGDYGSGFSIQLIGLAGYLLAPGRSLLLFAPWALLILPTIVALFRRQLNWETGVAAGVVGFYLVHAMWQEWEGGWSFGPRLLIPILPVIALTVANAFVKFPRLVMFCFLPASLLQIAALPVDPMTTHLNEIVREGATFEEMAAGFRETVWSPLGNIVVLQLKAIATPEYFVWLVIWAIVCAAWIGYLLTSMPIENTRT